MASRPWAAWLPCSLRAREADNSCLASGAPASTGACSSWRRVLVITAKPWALAGARKAISVANSCSKDSTLGSTMNRSFGRIIITIYG